MAISFTLSNDNVDMMLDDLRRIFPSLMSGSALPPMQEQPKENREPLPAENVKERKPRAKKEAEAPKEDAKASEGEQVATTAATSEEQTNTAETSSSASTADTASSAEIPDIEDLRARLKTLGATEGFGHDKVFEVLGKYGAKNASTVPEDKRAACIAEIDELLKGGK